MLQIHPGTPSKPPQSDLIKYQSHSVSVFVLTSPEPGSCGSPEPAVSSQSWWGKGCPCAYRATASVVEPYPAGPDVCVAPSLH